MTAQPQPSVPRTPLSLPLPAPLAELLAAGRWQHPGEDVLHEALPWFEDPVDFLASVTQIARESRALDALARDTGTSQAFRIARGSSAAPLGLPWLDADMALLIAVNRHPGDDTAIALDYRDDPKNPAVVASDAWTDPGAYRWRTVTPDFPSFAAMLGIRR